MLETYFTTTTNLQYTNSNYQLYRIGGYLPSLYDASELFEASPIQLFISMYHSNQCLHHLLPLARNLCFNLKATGHSVN